MQIKIFEDCKIARLTNDDSSRHGVDTKENALRGYFENDIRYISSIPFDEYRSRNISSASGASIIIIPQQNTNLLSIVGEFLVLNFPSVPIVGNSR